MLFHLHTSWKLSHKTVAHIQLYVHPFLDYLERQSDPDGKILLYICTNVCFRHREILLVSVFLLKYMECLIEC